MLHSQYPDEVLLLDVTDVRVESTWQLDESGLQSSGNASLREVIVCARQYSDPFESWPEVFLSCELRPPMEPA